MLVCEQGAVVGGVYTRDVLPDRHCQSLLPSSHSLSTAGADYSTARASCRSELAADSVESAISSVESHPSSVECCSQHTSVTDSITVVSSLSAAVSASASTQLSASAASRVSANQHSSVSASQPSVSISRACRLSSPPVRSGILPPMANVNVNASSVVGGAQQQFVDKTLSLSVTPADKDWREFEEALSDEFISFSPAGISQQSKNAVCSSYSSSYALQPLKPPGLTMPSNVPFYTSHSTDIISSVLPVHVAV